MATVTVSKDVITGSMAKAPSPYIVQRFRRMGATSGEQAAMTAKMSALGVDLLTVHIGGGYSNATSSTQQWAMRDPLDSVGVYTYSTVGSRLGLADVFSWLGDLRATRPSAKVLLVLHDHPKAMLGGRTRANTDNFTWPPAAEFSKYLPLFENIEATYPGLVYGISYGQELKGLVNRTDTSTNGELDVFAAGFNVIAPLVRASGSVGHWKIGYPHINIFASNSLSTRNTNYDALIGGSQSTLAPGDETIFNFLLPKVDPDDVDFLTVDYSVIDYSTSHTWRPGFGGNYDTTVKPKLTMPEKVMARLRAMMTTHWGTQKPIYAIERYVDVNQLEQDWMSESQMAAANMALTLSAIRGGVDQEMWWEPNGGTAGSESPTGNLMSWWDVDGNAFDLYDYLLALYEAIPPGTDIVSSSSDSGDIHALASPDKTYIVNVSSSSVDVTLNVDGGLVDTTIAAYGYVALDNPEPLGVIVNDTFTRTSSTSFGSADVGGVWTSTGGVGTAHVTTGSTGTMIHTGATQTRQNVLGSAVVRNSETLVEFWSDKVPTGGAHEVYVTARQLNTTDDNLYAAVVSISTANAISLGIRKRLSDVQSDVVALANVARETNAANRHFWLRFRVTDNGTTATLSAKVWQDGTSEPGSWDVSGTDTSAALCNDAGSPGLRTYNGASSNTPNTFGFDNLTVLNVDAPETYSGTFSITGGGTTGMNYSPGMRGTVAVTGAGGVTGNFQPGLRTSASVTGGGTVGAPFEPGIQGSFSILGGGVVNLFVEGLANLRPGTRAKRFAKRLIALHSHR